MPIGQQVGASSKSEIEWSPSTGIHPAVIREIADAGISEYKGQEDHRGIAVFQVLDEHVEFDDGNKRNKDVWVFFSLRKGLGKVKATKNITTLRKILEGIRGKAYTEAELHEFVPKAEGGGGKLLDLDKLEGIYCTIGVKHDAESGKAKVEAFYAWDKAKPKPALPEYETLAERAAKKETKGSNAFGGGKPSGGDALSAMVGGAPTADDEIPF